MGGGACGEGGAVRHTAKYVMMGIKQLYVMNRIHFESCFWHKCHVTIQFKFSTPTDSPPFPQLHTVTHSATIKSQCTFAFEQLGTYSPSLSNASQGSQRAFVQGSDPLAMVLYRLEQLLQFRVVLRCTCKTRDQRNAPLSGIVLMDLLLFRHLLVDARWEDINQSEYEMLTAKGGCETCRTT